MTTGTSDPAAPVPMADRVEIAERAFDEPDASRLLRAFYDEQVGRYGFAETIDVDPAGYAAPDGVFAVMYYCGVPVGCGGHPWYHRAAGTIEVKTTYAGPAAPRRRPGRGPPPRLHREPAAA